MRVNQSRVALAAIAVVIPLAMMASINTDRETIGNPDDGRLQVVTSFYPLYEFASRVGGGKADVSVMIPPAIEPHDWEPTFSDVMKAKAADMLVVNGAGFEQWIDDIGTKKIVTTSEGLSDSDPHFWLDPVLAKHQVEAIRTAMADADPDNAYYYNDNAAKFSTELDALDSFIRSELVSCDKTDFISFHDSFGRFADRYGLVQHSIHGISPDGEILPQRIQETVKLASDLHIKVVYAEELMDRRLAEVIADEIPGSRVLSLSPVEGISKEEQAAGIGYIEKMESNVASLKEGLSCR